MIHELREYTAHGHTVQQLHDRFADSVLLLFEKHGIGVVGFWTDGEDETKIVYLVQFADAEEKARAWSEFQNDPEWKRVKAESEADGPIVDQMTSRTLLPVAYWPRNASTQANGR